MTFLSIVLEKKHQHLHGIVPPLKNVRRRRFRKTLRKKPIDLASIEKEVKRLLRTDLEAVEVKYEEIADDDAPCMFVRIFTFSLGTPLSRISWGFYHFFPNQMLYLNQS